MTQRRAPTLPPHVTALNVEKADGGAGLGVGQTSDDSEPRMRVLFRVSPQTTSASEAIVWHDRICADVCMSLSSAGDMPKP